ncbi:DNA replication/repair protein RecF [Salipiger sp. IMCC34102]|uniref:DNA replication/repair protein RecF n=1 Tax=Salipiger sp. IMCC34102 TaxID=2510647 RepID=UPI00101DA334|nr:DNA replication/repair protein RecF [Salipiger sp. IMCC34102]RYH01589.1 DNA replication/repair protein RecF [Salipiger sp. IMCC34102]
MGGLSLSHLRLSHFRSHRQARLDVDPRPVAIFGPNGAGKTNLIEAISFLSPGRGLRRAATGEVARKPESLGWKVAARVEANHTIEIETGAEGTATRDVRIDGKATTQTALASVLRVLWLIPAMDRLWIEGAEGRRRFLDRATLSFVPDHAEASLSYERAMRERNRLLKDMVRDAHWYAALEARMAEAGAQVQANRIACLEALRTAQDGAETAFPAADLSLSDGSAIPAQGAEALRAAFAEGRARDLSAGRTLSGPHRGDLEAVFAGKGVPARDCSTGEQKALLISLILANARALQAQVGRPPVLLLDEVAAHLDEARRAALYDEICALGAQAWMTGTEVGLFDALGGRAQYLEVTEADALSVVNRREPA